MPTFACTPSTVRGLPLFSTLSDAEVATLMPLVQVRSHYPRTLVLGPGTPIDGLYIIVSGRVNVLLEDERGRQVIAAQLREGDICGELGLMQEVRSSEAIETVTKCELIHVPRKAVLECLERNPRAAMFMLNLVTERLRDTRRNFGSLALETVLTRVLKVLLEQGHQLDTEWWVDVGAETIAALVGSSREMVSRVVKGLVERGLVRRHKRKLIVIDRSRLAQYAEGHCDTGLRKKQMVLEDRASRLL
jgi:CRP/FNR family transcriptional regulator, cyclic AMP receptor protein